MITLVKVGGAVLEAPEKKKRFLKSFSELKGTKVLVHGGGATATAWADKMGVETTFINGRRVTSLEMLEIIIAVYSGINKTLTAELNFMGVPALGLCGGDESLIPANKRPKEPVDFGEVGDVLYDFPLSTLFLDALKANKTPVISALSVDVGTGKLLNTNADTIVQFLATKLAEITPVKIVYSFGLNGVLSDLNDPKSVIHQIKESELNQLVTNGIVHNGMLPKLENGFSALNYGAKEVSIAPYTDLTAGTNLIIA